MELESNEFYVGQRVMVKPVKELVEELGRDRAGFIDVSPLFTDKMEECCGECGVVRAVSARSVMIKFDNGDEEGGMFYYALETVRPVDDLDPVCIPDTESLISFVSLDDKI